jgi:hypothetical protein
VGNTKPKLNAAVVLALTCKKPRRLMSAEYEFVFMIVLPDVLRRE